MDEVRGLPVWWAQDRVGTIVTTDGERMDFAYATEWLSKPDTRAISFSLPLKSGLHGEAAHAFFSNFLPEGDLRRRVASAIRVSEKNDFSMLKELGPECAGALSIGVLPVDDTHGQYEEIDAARFASLLREGAWTDTPYGSAHGVRLSIAGAQAKFAARYQAPRFSLPLDGAASTHIVKMNPVGSHYPHIAENEYFVTTCARSLGLNVVAFDLKSMAGEDFFLSVRYDRKLDPGGWPVRLHQEDFCQALGLPASKKYQHEGGPSFRDCIRFSRSELGLLAVNSLVDLFLFNLCVGNCDAHGKNFSILYDESHRPALAPFYDLVCTLAYPRLSREMAMRCGNASALADVTLVSLSELAAETGVTERYVKSRFRAISGAWKTVLADAERLALQTGMKEDVLEGIASPVRSQWMEMEKRAMRGT